MFTNPKNLFILRSFSVFYITLPILLFSAYWLKQPYSIVSVAITILFMVKSLNALRVVLKEQIKNRNPIFALENISVHVGVVILFTVWVFFSGTGGFGFQNTDYRASNALFKDLIVHDWPIELVIDGVSFKYVYYMAYYLPAALVGKVLGWEFANYFLFFWTVVGIILAYYWFVRTSNLNSGGSKKLFVIAIAFCLFGGLDLFGELYLQNLALKKISGENEWWAGFFQYSSNTTLVYWVPQQAVAVWIITGFVVDAFFTAGEFEDLGIVLFSGIIWSPFGVLGVLPFLFAAILLRIVIKKSFFLNKLDIAWNLASLWVGSFLALYIVSNQLKFPFGFGWSFVEDQGRFFKYILAFWFLEFGFLAALLLLFLALGAFRKSGVAGPGIYSHWKKNINNEFCLDSRQICLFAVSIFVLIALPFIRIGVYNDIVMRTSIPALFVFYAFVVKIIIDSSIRVRLKYNIIFSTILAVVILGFHPAVKSIAASYNKFHFGPPNFDSITSSFDANSIDIVRQRSGSSDSLFYRYFGK